MSDLSSIERLKIEALFGMESGYVLNFSDNTFSMFIVENIGVDIFDSKYAYGSNSKANRLRKFWLEESNEVVGKLLSALLDYWLAKKQTSGEELSLKEKTLYDECQKIVSRLHQGSFSQAQENTSSQLQRGRTITNGTDMTEAKRPLKVFLCHARSDKDTVKALYTRLINDSVDTWLDVEKLLPGQDREYEIRKAVHESDVVVVCLSGQFNQAGFQQREVRLALDTALELPDGEIFLIPARLEECDVPERLQRYHWVDLFDDSGYGMLMKALKLRDEQLERARIRKEDAVKRRLPYFETSVTRDNVMQREIGSSNVEKKLSKNTPLHESSVKSEFPESKEQLSHKKTKDKKRIKTEYVVAIIGAIATIVAGVLSSPWIEKWLSPALSIPTATATITLTQPFLSSIPTSTPYAGIIDTVTATNTQSVELGLTPTKVVTVASAQSLTEIKDDQGVPMMLVPADTFIMGSEHSHSDEQPVHIVNLAAYYVDKYEVTNALYKTCVIMGGCTSTHSVANNYRFDYYENPIYENYPVAMVDWDQASAYCEWRGARLPTEAEWEKASRGVDGGTYSWGNDKNFDCSYANYYGCEGDTTQVGSYEKGKSPYGIYDMIGNVWEWVYDWYGSDYYKTLSSNVSNPQGPSTPSYGYTHIIRGSSYMDLSDGIRASLRSPNLTAYSSNIGFRCAKDAP